MKQEKSVLEESLRTLREELEATKENLEALKASLHQQETYTNTNLASSLKKCSVFPDICICATRARRSPVREGRWRDQY